MTRASLIFLFLVSSAPACAFDQTGLYVGLTGTLAPGEVNDQVQPAQSLSGGMVGGQIGYRFHAGMLVPGLEADYVIGSSEMETANTRMGVDQFGTLRATLGVDMGPLLPYISAGAAIAQASAEDKTFLDPVQSNVHLGLTAGAGLEFALTGGLSLRGEYQYITLEPMDYSFQRPMTTLEYDLHAIKFGANLSF